MTDLHESMIALVTFPEMTSLDTKLKVHGQP